MEPLVFCTLPLHDQLLQQTLTVVELQLFCTKSLPDYGVLLRGRLFTFCSRRYLCLGVSVAAANTNSCGTSTYSVLSHYLTMGYCCVTVKSISSHSYSVLSHYLTMKYYCVAGKYLNMEYYCIAGKSLSVIQ